MSSSLLRTALSRRALSPSASLPGLRQGQKRFAGGVHWSEPTGKLFGETAPAPGKKRVKEDWENIYYYGFGGGMVLGAVLIYYKPDTSIEGWARKEAQKKMAEAGETPSYQKSA
ncbi:uncharacterized protein JCM10292_003765 [Rhodotorula paludigena]|uniref:uncharacterized protein n=1 Tax=Rhodotorula paludigena TaxID=86838 RepID=UPI0031767BE1